jgi:hypothetical protein
MLAMTILTGDWIEVPNECTITGATRTEIEVSGDEVILICPCCNGTGEHSFGILTYYCTIAPRVPTEETDNPTALYPTCQTLTHLRQSGPARTSKER